MKLTEFLKKVVPSTGHVVTARKETGTKNGKEFTYFSHGVANSPEEILPYVKSGIAAGKDMYYALASFKQGFHTNAKGKKVIRVRENVKELKALWFDIDFKSGLSNPVAVVAALQTFSAVTRMPAPSILVHSGNGVHAYWPLSRAIPLDEWQPLADAFKEQAIIHALAADLACTADSCRVLRPPGTKNFKDPTAPKPVYFLYSNGTEYDPDELRNVLNLGTIVPNLGTNEVPAHLRNLAEIGDEFSGGLSKGKRVEAYFSNIVKKCAVAKHIEETKGADQTEPEWTSTLQLLKHCEDGALQVHDVSSGHSDYSADETEDKWQQRLGNNAGPTLCTTFEIYHPSKCKACPFYGKIKTPLTLGEELAAVGAPPGVILKTWRPVPQGNGMEQMVLNTETNQYEWVKVLGYTFTNILISRSVVTRHYEIQFQASLFGSVPIIIALPSGHLGNEHKLKETMANFGTPLLGTEVKPFVKFMSTWLKKLQESQNIDEVTEQLGWIHSADDDKHAIIGFSAGTASYYTDGTERKGVRIGKEFAAIGRMYEPSGKIDPWKRVANFICEQNNPAFTSILSSAFASPLLKFTGVQGGILSIVSPESGVGKSSALKCAQAVWGSPTHGMNSVDDTRLSVARKLGFLNNLPAYWDELRGRKTMEDFMTLAFQVSQGKEKTRLDSTATMREVNTWETMLIAASNESIFDYMGAYSAGSDAGVARTYEITVEPFDSARSRAEIAMMFEALTQNYGHAGQKYARHIAMNHIAVCNLVQDVFMKVSKAADMRASERFWFAIIASLIAGAKLANDCGLTNIDTKSMGSYLMKNVTSLRARSLSSMNSSNPQELVSAYMQQHQDKALIVEEIKVGRGGSYEPVVIAAPAAKRIVYQVGRKQDLVRVSKTDFVRWLKESRDITFNGVAKHLKTELKMVELKTFLGLGTNFQLSRQTCLDFHMEFKDIDAVLGDDNAKQ